MITSSAFLNIPWRSLRLLSKRSARSVQRRAAEVQRIHLLRASVNRARTRLHCRPRTFAGSGVAHSGILKTGKGGIVMRRPTAAMGSAVFFLLAPGVVVGLIPWLLTEGWQLREPLPYWMPMRVLGGVLLAAGVIALVGAFVRFVVEGLGTPAPVAAPERLVVGGVYRFVRN